MVNRSNSEEIAGGVVHALPEDLRRAIAASSAAVKAWGDITPLARNEWICWIESAKKRETRERRMRIALANLIDGKRRPCCWPGCPHR